MKDTIHKRYGLDVINISRVLAGVGGATCLVETTNGNYILKGVDSNDIYVQNEPYVVGFLKECEIPTAEYIQDVEGQYIWKQGNLFYHLQTFIDGQTIPFNEAPDWFMHESAQTLGRIHTALSSFKRLPTGIGDSFIQFMMSEHPKNSYMKTIEKAKSLHDCDVIEDIGYRLSQVDKLKNVCFDLSKFSYCNTHGDYKISQIICKDDHIAAVIDWTGACYHPVCWEIIRSFTYADPYCKNGEIDMNRFIEYVKTYLQYHALNEYDLKMMPYFFYHQILACDYYGQYYGSTNVNKYDFLHQAKFATALIKWFENNVGHLSERLLAV